MKKIVVINASPSHKGYTLKMSKIVTDHFSTLNLDVDIEYVNLIKQNLKMCIGCCRCLAKGGGGCPLKDDSEGILNKMKEADGLIFASPGYSHMVSGLYKNFMDRFMYLDHIPDIDLIGKPCIVLSTSGAEGVMTPPKYMSDNGVLWWGCDVTDVIGVASAMYVASDKYAKKTEEKLRKAALSLWRGMESESKRKPSFKQYIYFKFNQVEDQIGGDNQPYRKNHWKVNGWTTSDYYYDTTINPLFKVAGWVVNKVIKIGYKTIMGSDAKEKINQYLEQRY